MGLTKISLRKSVLLNLGDYQNCKIEAGGEYELGEGDTSESAHVALGQELDRVLLAEATSALENMPSFRRWEILNALHLKELWDALHPEPGAALNSEEAMTPQPLPASYFDPENVDDDGNLINDDEDLPAQDLPEAPGYESKSGIPF